MNKKNYYKLERTKKGIKAHQIIDGWHFITNVPSTMPIIIKKGDEDE